MAKVKKTLFKIPYVGVLFVIFVLILIVVINDNFSPLVSDPNLNLQTPVLQTKVIDFRPEVPSDSQNGTCFTNSVIAPVEDAWRCTVGNQIYDPCILAKDGKSLVCGEDPSTDTPGFVLTLTSPLPEPDFSPDAPHNPWMLELASGRICSFSQGASGVIDGQRINYYCVSTDENSDVVLIGEIKQGKLWNATRAVLEKNTTNVIQTGVVPIKKAWVIK